MRIYFGDEATWEKDTPVSFSSNILRKNDPTSQNGVYESVSVSYGNNHPVPVLSIIGPTVVAACTSRDPIVYTSNSAGNVDRAWKEYYWSLEGVSDGNALYGPLSNFSKSVTYSTASEFAQFSAIGSFTLTLTATNWLGVSNTFSLPIVSTDAETPTVGTNSATIVTLTRSSPNHLLELEYNVDCATSKTVTFSWTGLPSGAKGTIISEDDPSTFVIDPSTFPYGTFNINGTATLGAKSAVQQFEITIVPQNLVPFIHNGGALVVNGEDITLSASGSYDPDKTSETTIFEWDCTSSVPCNITVNNHTNTLLLSTFGVGIGVQYTITLVMTKGTRTQNYTTTVTTVCEETAPAVIIGKKLVNVDRVIQFISAFQSPNNTYTWTLYPMHSGFYTIPYCDVFDYEFNFAKTQEYYVNIVPGALRANTDYTIKLSVNGKECTSFEFSTFSSPYGGSLSVTKVYVN